MARYLVLERSFVNSVLVEAGAEVEYSGLPDANLQPLDQEGKDLAAQRIADIKDRKAKADARVKFVEGLKNDPNFEDLL